MALQLTALAVITKDLSSVPITASITSSLKKSNFVV